MGPEDANNFQRLGELSWLWMNSPLHRNWSIDLLMRFTMPPITRNQYILLTRGGIPTAYCSWAFFNLEAEGSYVLDPSSLNERDWNSGDRMWIIDWIAPFSRRDSFELKKALGLKYPRSVTRAIRVRAERTKAKVLEHWGPGITRTDAERELRKYHTELVEHLAKNNHHFNQVNESREK